MILRDRIVPFVNARQLLGFDFKGADDKAIIVLMLREKSIGLFVDQVNDVLVIAPESLQPAPFMQAAGTRHVCGIDLLGQRMPVLLGPDAPLSGEDSPVVEAV